MEDLIKYGKIPPVNPDELSSPEKIAEQLQVLIGRVFQLSGKPRTDGSNFRKLITSTLMAANPPQEAKDDEYLILPPKGKGVPSFLRQYIDTYIVTTGETYNLQVWNRDPNSDFIQIEYQNGSRNLMAKDVTFVFGKINPITHKIDSIVVTKPDTIVSEFGPFGVPTSKQQLIISNTTRTKIINSHNKYIFYPDDPTISNLLNPRQDTSNLDLKSKHVLELLPLDVILGKIQGIIGEKLTLVDNKQKGQELERLIAHYLGYKIPDNMDGGYPDLANQMLEVKVQDSPTVDLGRYTPQTLETIVTPFNTKNIRYLIALTNKETNTIEGFYLGPGSKLGQHFSYVADKSVKYQRSIKMNFFTNHTGKSVAIY
ncbi:MAG: nuclease [Culicoidibacterales bacterium]